MNGNSHAAIQEALRVVQRTVQGDLEARIIGIDSEGPLGELMHEINALLDVVDAFSREARASMDFAARGMFFRRVMEPGLLGTFRHSARSLNSATHGMEEQAAQLQVAERTRREAARVMDEVVDSVARSTVQLKSKAERLSEVSGSGVSSANTVTESSQMAAEDMQTIAGATEEMNATARDVEAVAHQAAKRATAAVEAATEACSTIQGLCEVSSRIGMVVRSIGQVASQTRMLALNATIEAARAGEMGRGFTVVASEVKQLAHETSAATEEINRQIESVQASSASAASVVDEVGRSVGELNRFAAEIAEAVRQQQIAICDISKSLQAAAQRAPVVFQEAQVVTQHAAETNTVAGVIKEEADSLSRQVEILREQALLMGGKAS